MTTPIVDFSRAYKLSAPTRFHMPGHKGVGEAESVDLTEIDGADDLYSPSGIIKESEDNLSYIYGASSFYSTEGSSQSIRAAVYLTFTYLKSIGKRPLILAARNAHKSFVSAVGLCDGEVEWIASGTLHSASITRDKLDTMLKKTGAGAVYLTSPDYLGNMLDIGSLSEVAHRHGAILIVDNAHGAYLRFLPESAHPIDLGADISLDSAHKTLPVITGGGYIHLSRSLPPYFAEHLKWAMSLFGSTSPSYLILESLDRVNPYLVDGFSSDLSALINKISEIKQGLVECGYTLVGDEKMKITIMSKPYGYYGGEINEILKGENIYIEFYDKDYLVFMPSVRTEFAHLDRLFSVLSTIPKRSPITDAAPSSLIPERRMSVREAIMSPSVRIPVCEAEGRILSECAVSCPPAIPVVVSGEVIDRESIERFLYYGIDTVSVVE